MQRRTQLYFVVALVLGTALPGCLGSGSNNDAPCKALFGDCTNTSPTDAGTFPGQGGPVDANFLVPDAGILIRAFDAGGGVGSAGATCNSTKQGFCNSGNFCEFAAGSCGTLPSSRPATSTSLDAGFSVDAGILPPMFFPSGMCTAQKQACTAITSPVCGCDNKTYTNDCLRKVAGISKFADGPCAADSVVIVGEGVACGKVNSKDSVICSSGLFCEFETKGCSMPTARGVCKPRPVSCEAAVNQVCGCDGVTYKNDCNRRQAGQALAFAAACPSTNLLVGVGVWGGPQLELTIKDPNAGGIFKFECGQAEISTPLDIDSNNSFMWKASYSSSTGGAVRDAVVTGMLGPNGNDMKVTVQIVGAMSPTSFALQLGVAATFSGCPL